MTYNFDPEKWYENKKALLEKRLSDGEISREEFEEALDALDRELQEMWERLDGTFRLPE